MLFNLGDLHIFSVSNSISTRVLPNNTPVEYNNTSVNAHHQQQPLNDVVVSVANPVLLKHLLANSKP